MAPKPATIPLSALENLTKQLKEKSKSVQTSLSNSSHNELFIKIKAYKDKLAEIKRKLTEINKVNVKYNIIQNTNTGLKTDIANLEFLKTDLLNVLNEYKNNTYILCSIAYQYNDGTTMNTGDISTKLTKDNENYTNNGIELYHKIFKCYAELNVIIKTLKASKDDVDSKTNINKLTSEISTNIENSINAFELYESYTLKKESSINIHHELTPELFAEINKNTEANEEKEGHPPTIGIYQSFNEPKKLAEPAKLLNHKLDLLRPNTPSLHTNIFRTIAIPPSVLITNESVIHVNSLSSAFDVSAFSDLFDNHGKSINEITNDISIMTGGGFEYQPYDSAAISLEMKLKIHGNIFVNINKLYEKIQKLRYIDDDIADFKNISRNPDILNILIIHLHKLYKLLNDQIETFTFLLDEDTSIIPELATDHKKKDYMLYLLQYGVNTKTLIDYYLLQFIKLISIVSLMIAKRVVHVGGNRVAKKYHQKKTRRIHEKKAMFEIKNIYNSRRNGHSKSKKLKAYHK